MTNEEAPFGQALYEALKWQAGGERIVGRLNYARIQQLKAADRAGVKALFKGTTDYLTLQHIRRDTPKELAEFLIRRATPAHQGGTSAVAGIFLLGMLLND